MSSRYYVQLPHSAEECKHTRIDARFYFVSKLTEVVMQIFFSIIRSQNFNIRNELIL